MDKKGSAGILVAVITAVLIIILTPLGQMIGAWLAEVFGGKSCPKIAGHWQLEPEGIGLIINQRTCKVSGTYETEKRRYEIDAECIEGKREFTGTLLKIAKTPGDCTSTNNLSIEVKNENTSIEMKTSGRDCDGASAEGRRTWTR